MKSPAPSARIRKYRFHYLLVLPALLIIAVTRFLPFLYELYMSFLDLNFTRGLFENQWVWFENYLEWFANPDFGTVMSDTLLLRGGSILLTGAVALVLALALGAIRSDLLRRFYTALFLIPFFLPAVVVSYFLFLLLSPTTGSIFPFPDDLLGSERIRLVLIGAELLKTCGIPVLLALAAMSAGAAGHGGYWHRSAKPAAMAIAAFMIIQTSMLLYTDLDAGILLVDSEHGSWGGYNYYQFREGASSGEFAETSVMSVFQFAVHLPLAIAAYALLKRLFKPVLFPPAAVPAAPSGKSSSGLTAYAGGLSGLFGALAYALVVLLFLAVVFAPLLLGGPAGSGGFRVSDFLTVTHFGVSLANISFVTAIGAMLALTLAFPMTVRDLPGRKFYRLMLLGSVVVGQSFLGSYLLSREFYISDTIYGYAFYGFLSVAGAFVLKIVFNNRYAGLREQAEIEGRSEAYIFFRVFVPNVRKPLAGIAVLQFAALWNTFVYPLMFINNDEYLPPVVRLRHVIFGNLEHGLGPTDPLVGQIAAIVSLPPIILFLLCRKLVTAETFLSGYRK